jgi:hypothetical protein
MATRSRIRKQIDFGRLREALAGPRADSRSWNAIARVDDTPDAVQFIPGYGWVADVTFVSGELGGEGPIPCRVLSFFGRPDEATVAPVALGAEVVVMVTDGDVNVQPVILGYLHNPTDSPIPTTVNGVDVSEGYAAANVVARSTSGLNAELGPVVRVSATSQFTVEGPQIRLADDTAVQSFVRGQDIETALNNLATALSASGAFVSILPAANPITASPALLTAFLNFGTALAASMSSRIRGE